MSLLLFMYGATGPSYNNFDLFVAKRVILIIIRNSMAIFISVLYLNSIVFLSVFDEMHDQQIGTGKCSLCNLLTVYILIITD